MAMDDKMCEEKAKMKTTFVESIDANGITTKQTFNSEVIGTGRFPGGMNTGSGAIHTAWTTKGMANGTE